MAHCMEIRRCRTPAQKPSAAHTVELWENVRHTAGFGRGVVRISEIPARAAGQLGMLPLVEDEPTARSDTVQRVVQPPNVIGALDRGTEGTSLVTRQRGEQVPRLISRDVSAARGRSTGKISSSCSIAL